MEIPWETTKGLKRYIIMKIATIIKAVGFAVAMASLPLAATAADGANRENRENRMSRDMPASNDQAIINQGAGIQGQPNSPYAGSSTINGDIANDPAMTDRKNTSGDGTRMHRKTSGDSEKRMSL